MKSSLFSFLLVLLYSSGVSGLELKVGDSIHLPVLTQSKIHIGSRRILTAIDQGDKVLLIGKKAGETVITLDGKTLKVKVHEPSSSHLFDDLKALFKKRMGLKVKWKKSRVVVHGDIHVFEDWLEISQLARKWRAPYEFTARPNQRVLREATKHFQSQASTLHIGSFQISDETPLKVFVNSKDKDSFKRATELFESFGMRVEKSQDLINVKPLIKTSVILAEVSRQASQSLGIQFPAQAEGQLLPELKGPESLMVSLKALESKGLGKVLASPTLNCRSGASAEFHAGGEFPIRLTGYRRQAVEWKKHGVVLKVKPRADRLGAIQLSIETEISLIDSTQIVDGLPALKTNRVSSHFDLKGKNTIALSGLIQETWGRGQSGLLGLSRIPVLGALFRSQDFLNHKSELVVFVTPEVIDTETKGEIRWPKGWLQDE